MEQQGRLRIHHHGVGWIAGIPKTKSDWEQLLGNCQLKAKFEQYCKSLFSAELPIFDTIDDIRCPVDSCSGFVNAIEIPAKYKHILKASVPQPIVAKRTRCQMEFSNDGMIDSALRYALAEVNADQQIKCTNEAVKANRMRLCGMDDDMHIKAIQMSRSLRIDQTHAYEHTPSCVKGRHSTKCRYRFFRELEPRTGFTDTNEVVFRRRIGNQWVNTYIPLWRRIFPFNMDARLLWMGDGLQAERYAIQYASKRQTVLDNAAIVELAFHRRIHREQQLNNQTDYQQALGRLLSLAYSSSGTMEIGGPLATAIILEDGAATFSCNFERLPVVEGLNMLDGLDLEVGVVAHNGIIYTQTCIRKYSSRPGCLEDWNWYDFTAWISGTPNAESVHCSTRTTCSKALATHLKEHNLRKLACPHVPELICPRLPDTRRLGSVDYTTESELYYRMSLLLYCPFRDPMAFLDHNRSAKTYYLEWNSTHRPKICRQLEYHQQYYLGLDAAQVYRSRQATIDTDDNLVDEDILQNSREESQQQTHHLISIPSNVYSAELSTTQNFDSTDGTQISYTEAKVAVLHENYLGDVALPPDCSHSVTVRPKSVSKNELSRLERHISDCSQQSEGLNMPSLSNAGPASVLVEKLEDATRDLSYKPDQPPDAELMPFASIAEVSAYHHLNSGQHQAFVLVAFPLLCKIADAPPPDAHKSLCDGSPVIVTGAGGTGKSEIVEALRDLCVLWGRVTAIMITASTGIAAANLGGVTMHNSIGIGINQTARLPKHLQQPKDDMLQRWAPVKLVVADELSMADLSLVGIWEEAMRKLKESNEPFGGMQSLLMFDHFQLLPVRGFPLFRKPNPLKPFSTSQQRGSQLYQSVTKVVYLNENMRFRNDPEWGSWLAKARRGKWHSELKHFLESAHLNRCRQDHQFVQIVSSDNATRAAVNERAMKTAALVIPDARKVYVIPALLTRTLTSVQLEKIKSYTDNRTGNLPLFLKVYIGKLRPSTEFAFIACL